MSPNDPVGLPRCDAPVALPQSSISRSPWARRSRRVRTSRPAGRRCAPAGSPLAGQAGAGILQQPPESRGSHRIGAGARDHRPQAPAVAPGPLDRQRLSRLPVLRYGKDEIARATPQARSATSIARAGWRGRRLRHATKSAKAASNASILCRECTCRHRAHGRWRRSISLA